MAMDWKTPQAVARHRAYIERIYQSPRMPLVIEQQRLDSARTKLAQKYQQQCIGVRWGVCFFQYYKTLYALRHASADTLQACAGSAVNWAQEGCEKENE
jgi:hypothetical protein